jgi:hypothetical protein
MALAPLEVEIKVKGCEAWGHGQRDSISCAAGAMGATKTCSLAAIVE